MGTKEGIEGSGLNYHDKVSVSHLSRDTNGRVEAIHAGGKKIDVRIDHPGHPEHGRVVTFPANEVEARDHDE